jgi:hypothetical protein
MKQDRFYTFVGLMIGSAFLAVRVLPIFFLATILLGLYIAIVAAIDQDFNNRNR